MSATDELRRLLDERGVEYKYRDMFGKHVFHWGEPLHGAMFTDGGEWTDLVVENASPEQAVEATLGRGTCRQIETEEGFIVCSECGAPQPEDYTVYYCWCCGRKVVEE